MEDGRAANMRGDHLKLSKWAESWEKRHGKIWCEARVRNNERREQAEFVRGSTGVPQWMFEAILEVTKALRRLLAAHASTLRCYDAEKSDYAGKWVERTEERREALLYFREKWEPLEQDRRRYERQQANLQRLHEQQHENLKRLIEQEIRGASRQHGRGRSRSRDEGMER